MKSNPEKLAWELEKARNLIKVFDEQKNFKNLLTFCQYSIIILSVQKVR